MSEENKVEHPTRDMVLTGYKVLADGKLYGRWQVVLEESPWLEEEVRYYKAKEIKGFIGSIYKFRDPADDPSQIFINGIVYQGTWEDKEQVAQWKIQAEKEQTLHEMTRKEAKDKTKDTLAPLLEPIREQYRKCRTVRQRSAFLAVLLTYLED